MQNGLFETRTIRPGVLDHEIPFRVMKRPCDVQRAAA
jgi:hypothetical protein